MARKSPPLPSPGKHSPRDDAPGAKLRRLVERKRRGRHDREIAAAAGMSPSAFSRLLRGDVPDPRISTVIAILKAIGASMAEYEKA